MIRRMLGTLALVAAVALPVSAQDNVVPAPNPRPSPLALTSGEIGDVYVKVHYGAPQKRDRTIFGGLVPYGEVWRTGANEATEITVTGDVVFGGQPLAAGTYSIKTIPTESTWTVIVSRAVGSWGTQYDEQYDVLRVEVPSAQIDAMHEAFSMKLEPVDDGLHLVLTWDTTQVKVPITV